VNKDYPKERNNAVQMYEQRTQGRYMRLDTDGTEAYVNKNENRTEAVTEHKSTQKETQSHDE
jgi:hypothetical protein